MSDVTLEQVFELAKQLAPAKRLQLAKQLEASIPKDERDSVLRALLTAEQADLRHAGAYNHAESLYGKFAFPTAEWDENELNAYLHEVGTAWEEDMAELDDDE